MLKYSQIVRVFNVCIRSMHQCHCYWTATDTWSLQVRDESVNDHFERMKEKKRDEMVKYRPQAPV